MAFYSSISASLLYGLLALITYLAISIKIKKWRYKTESDRRGCMPPLTLKTTDFLGASTLRAFLKAVHEDRGPQFCMDTLDDMAKDSNTKECNTIRVPIFDYEVLVTRDLENVKAMFSSQSSDFDISAIRSGAWMPLLGLGIFTSRGDQWKHSRALVRPQFTRDQIADLDLEEKHVRLMLKVLDFKPDGWCNKLDIQDLFYNFSLDITTEFLYGQSVNSQTRALERAEQGLSNRAKDLEASDFGRNLDTAKVWIDKRGHLGKFYWLVTGKQFRDNCYYIKKHADRFVKERLEVLRKRSPNEKERTVKNGKFILMDELAKETQNPVELRNETLHVLAAGRDTTGALMGWCFFFLSRNARVYAKLRSVILNQFGSDVDKDIPYLELKNLTYLHNCINEALRIATVIPLNERTAQRNTTLPTGGGPNGDQPILVAKGTQVLVLKYAMQHRPDIWGEDAEEYRPERWDERRAGWEFIPFGMGLRQCPGREFGRISVAYVMVRFLQRFDKMESTEPDKPMRLHHAIENRSGNGVKVILHAADK